MCFKLPFTQPSAFSIFFISSSRWFCVKFLVIMVESLENLMFNRKITAIGSSTDKEDLNVYELSWKEINHENLPCEQ